MARLDEIGGASGQGKIPNTKFLVWFLFENIWFFPSQIGIFSAKFGIYQSIWYLFR
jgi:hypothetical protein